MRDRLNRRAVLKGAAALAAAGVLWRPATALADHESTRTISPYLTIDVACIGNSFSINLGEALDAENGDFRGAGFLVEGYIFPAGTIPEGPGFDPESATMTGLWLCRGHLMFHPGREAPHGVTIQEYMLGEVSPEHPSPVDQLVSSGVEGGVEMTVRSVIGGTGRFRNRARGQVDQVVLGTNTTILNEFGDPAPNFRFRFYN